MKIALNLVERVIITETNFLPLEGSRLDLIIRKEIITLLTPTSQELTEAGYVTNDKGEFRFTKLPITKSEETKTVTIPTLEFEFTDVQKDFMKKQFDRLDVEGKLHVSLIELDLKFQ